MGFFNRAISDIKSEVEGIVTDAKEAINGVLPPKPRTGAEFKQTDYRTKLRVPTEYLSRLPTTTSKPATTPSPESSATAAEAAASATPPDADTSQITVTAPRSGITSSLIAHGGIIFPYTPTISYDSKANYSEQNVMHSNYTQYFYKNSSVSSIRIEGKFTVQNPDEGVMLLATIHLLRSLTKMRFGNDPLAGSPPPICRLDAYGDYMLKNVPVSVASFTHSLPDNVDYITVGKYDTMVPVLSTISIELNVMYSRQEMFDYDVRSWISGSLTGKTGKGYL